MEGKNHRFRDVKQLTAFLPGFPSEAVQRAVNTPLRLHARERGPWRPAAAQAAALDKYIEEHARERA